MIKTGLSLTYSMVGGQYIGTFTTLQAHGFAPGQGVRIGDADPLYVSIDTVPSPTSFTFALSAPPPSSSIRFAGLWQFGQVLVENNVIELTQISPPGYDFGPSDAIPFAGRAVLPQYTFRRTVARGNVIRNLPGAAHGTFYGITFDGAEHGLVHGNVIDLPQPNPIFHSGSKSIGYFENQSSSGQLIRGTHGLGGAKADDLRSQIEDAFLFSI